MALTPQPLFRAQDVGTSTVLGPVVPRNWRLKSNKIGSLTPANPAAAYPRYNSADYTGNAYGDDVSQAKSNVAVARSDGGAAETLGPLWRTQADKATALGTVLAQDVGRPRGGIEPRQPYPAKTDTPLAAPVLTSLTPATAVAGAATPQFAIKLTGTGFTRWSSVVFGGVPAPSSIYTYISPTEMRVQMSPASSVAGTTTVAVSDHGVVTANRTFTWT